MRVCEGVCVCGDAIATTNSKVMTSKATLVCWLL